MNCATLLITLLMAVTNRSHATEAALPVGDQHLTHVLQETGQEIPFRLYVPKGYDGSKSYPLIVVLHGGGSDEDRVFDGTDIKSLAEARQVMVVAPRGYDKFGGYGNFLPIVTTPQAAARAELVITPASVRQAAELRSAQADHTSQAQAPEEKGNAKPATMEALAPASPEAYVEMPASKIIDPRVVDLSERDVMEVLDWVEARYRVDPRRVYLTGNSMGGIGTEFLAVKYPQLWAAVAPAGCPTPVWSYPFEQLSKSHVAVLFVHGELDNLSAPRWSRALADAGVQHGVDARFLLIPGASHVSGWPQALPQIFDFLLAHQRSQP
jgi:poly(3-hydroxybutyrate) depolymerase